MKLSDGRSASAGNAWSPRRRERNLSVDDLPGSQGVSIFRILSKPHVYAQYGGNPADKNVQQERQSVFKLVFAYVDPGVGATVLQLALAGTVGVGALVKLRWKSVKRTFGRGDEAATTPEKATETSQ